MRINYLAVLALAIMTIGICLSGICAAERSFRTEDLIFCAKEKNTVVGAKLLAGELFSLMVGLILLTAGQLPNVIFNGFHGINTPCQILVPFTAYPYTSGKLLLIGTGLYILSSLLVGAIVLFLSCILKNSIAAAGIVCVSVTLDLFLTIPRDFRVFSQIRCLTPLQVLINSSMTDPRLLKLGGSYLTAYQLAGIGYAFLILMFCLVTNNAGKRDNPTG